MPIKRCTTSISTRKMQNLYIEIPYCTANVCNYYMFIKRKDKIFQHYNEVPLHTHLYVKSKILLTLSVVKYVENLPPSCVDKDTNNS